MAETRTSPEQSRESLVHDLNSVEDKYFIYILNHNQKNLSKLEQLVKESDRADYIMSVQAIKSISDDVDTDIFGVPYREHIDVPLNALGVFYNSLNGFLADSLITSPLLKVRECKVKDLAAVIRPLGGFEGCFRKISIINPVSEQK